MQFVLAGTCAKRLTFAEVDNQLPRNTRLVSKMSFFAQFHTGTSRTAFLKDSGLIGGEIMLADNPKHWRDRAATIRGLAIKMAGSHAAILMNDLAVDYDKQAETASLKINGKSHRQTASRGSALLGGASQMFTFGQTVAMTSAPQRNKVRRAPSGA
jgi:hypothetical protein